MDSFVILPHSKQPLNTLNIAEKTSEENASLRYLKGLCHGCLVHFADRELKTRGRQKCNRFRLAAKQQLCTCITLFCTFVYRHSTTTT